MKTLAIGITMFALTAVGQLAFANSEADSEKVTICHKGAKTASIPASAVPGHQRHGDTIGACDSPDTSTMAAVVMMRCEPEEGSVIVVAASSSPSPAIDGGIVTGEDCAEVLAELLETGYGLRTVTTGSAEENGTLHLYTDYLLIGKAQLQQNTQ